MQEVALGYFGWTPDIFWQSTPREFANAYKGWIKAQDLKERGEWERARMVAYFASMPHKKKIKPADLMSFDWDGKKQPKRTPYAR